MPRKRIDQTLFLVRFFGCLYILFVACIIALVAYVDVYGSGLTTPHQLKAEVSESILKFNAESASPKSVLESQISGGRSTDQDPQSGSFSKKIHAQGLYPEWWGSPPAMVETVPCKDPGKCVSCHEDQSKMDPVHALPCIKCHKGNPDSEEKEEAHLNLISDPGDLNVVGETCGKCHKDESRRVKSSPMALAPRIINHTRFVFGAQDSPSPKYATVANEGIEQVPHPSKTGNLGDDLLRRACLRCHLYTRGSNRWGEHRGKGCSACHVPYPNNANGRHIHTIIRDIGITGCLKCHNANHVGTDYVGLFEKDSERGFRSPFVTGRQASRIYGSEQHFLISDLHFRAGMLCMDCHTLDEVHGTGHISQSPENSVRISCEMCHIRGDHPAVFKDHENELMLLRGQGRKIPLWNPKSIPHSVDKHQERLRCSACHAAWSYQDYGFHLMLEERADYWKWSCNAAQNDPQVQDLLLNNIGTYAELVSPEGGNVPAKPEEQWEQPKTYDWLTGEKRPGAWFRGFSERIWSRPPLGVDSRGKVSVMRPIYQYVISHVDRESNLLIDSHIPTTGAGFPALILNPYAPHTITAKGRSCQECHGNPKAIGFGEALRSTGKQAFKSLWQAETSMLGYEVVWKALVDEKGNQLQYSSHPNAGPLDSNTVESLLTPSQKHRILWFRYLSGEN